ncbi:uncharacterized protein LOC112255689 [Oncorhynchus tshawytscha]|uniref:uncharacterized protein LOC112255689 n=2 Tax=Oncorhynchus TaxID=8016 RepID=UPI001C3E6F2F|nr:uncharacterized protein LOC112255689 [Oncorhynchus tshawytscha]
MKEAPAAVEAAPVVVVAPVEAPKKEYIVVVLEGAAKTDKRPKVLGVGPMTGRIIPSPDDDEAPAAEVKGQATAA